MFRKILTKILLIQPLPKLLIRFFMNLHQFCYAIIGAMAIEVENGVHPKHRIMKYKEWFMGQINSENVVLDIGCNTGMMSEVMSHKAKYVYGIEILCNLIEEAKILRQRDNIEFICADATKYDYSKCQPIDCITLSNVLEHIEHRIDFLSKLIAQINWKNSNFKKIIIRVPMIDRDWLSMYKYDLGVEYRLDPTHYTEYTFEQFENELKQSNIQILSYHIKFGEIYAVCSAT
jgi:2-polyprenyl-3-methyl-5-hydroxy-6-metoxy-1,4-benzoquinol methylase